MNYPKIYDGLGNQVAILDNIIKDSAAIKAEVNGMFTFSFRAHEKELKSEYFDNDNEIEIEGQRFNITYIDQGHSGNEITYFIQCEHVSYELEDDPNILDNFTATGTPTAILTSILGASGFSVGTVDFTDPLTITTGKKTTRKKLVRALADTLGGKIEYTNNGRTIGIRDTLGQNQGFEIRFGKNLKGLNKVLDKRGGTLKTTYKVDLLELKNSNEYIEKGYSGLEVVELGDSVRVYDDVIGVDTTNLIVSIMYNPIFRQRSSVEIASTLAIITDTITEIQTTTITEGEVYNNVSISAEEGFVAERSDKLGKAVFNASELALKVGDGLGNYTDAVFFDVLEALYKFIGILEVTNTSNVTVKIDPDGANILEIKAGSTPLFTVSSSGVATFSDTINTNKDAIVGGVMQLGVNGNGALYFGNLAYRPGLISSGGSLTLFGTNLTMLCSTFDILGTLKIGGVTGSSGSFTTVDGKTVTVTNGIITSIV